MLKTRMEFTTEETVILERQTLRAAAAFEEIFELLCKVGDRTGREWCPVGSDSEAVREIVDRLSSELGSAYLNRETIVEAFGNPSNWESSHADAE